MRLQDFLFAALLEEHSGFRRDVVRAIFQAVSDQVLRGYLKGSQS